MIELLPEYEMSGYFPGLVEICRGEDGKMVFLIARDGKVFVDEKTEIAQRTVVPPESKDLPKSVREAVPDVSLVLEYVQREDRSLYEDVLSYLMRFSYLDEHQLALAAHYVFLTYLHDHADVSYCPCILFYAVPGRGKSRMGKSLTYVSFRGYHSIDMREAFIIRFAQNLHGTLFLDLTDLSKKAGKNNCEDMLLSRYEKGLECARVLYPDRGRFKDTEYFDVYGPTIIATNGPIDKVLETRCLPITMPNHPGNYENPSPDCALEERARLTAWRAKQLFAPLPDIKPICGIEGRLWDISKPLLQISRLIHPENGIHLEEAILRIATDKNEESRGSIEGRIVEIIHDISEENGLYGLPEWPIKASEITKRFNEARPADNQVSAAWMGLKLKSLSLRKRQVNGRMEYLITQSDYRMLHSQYGVALQDKYLPITLSRVEGCGTNPLPGKDSSIQYVKNVIEGCRGLRNMRDGQREMFEERAAIMEHEGGLSREEAEKKAALDQEIPF